MRGRGERIKEERVSVLICLRNGRALRENVYFFLILSE